MGTQAGVIVCVSGVEESDLGKHGVSVDKHLVTNSDVIISEPGCCGYIYEEIGIFQEVSGELFSSSVEFSVSSITVNPLVI